VVIVSLEDMDKTIEIIKAAMEKEKVMKDKEQEAKDQQTKANNQTNSQNIGEEADISEAFEETNDSDEIGIDNDADDIAEEDDLAMDADDKQGKTKGFFKSSKSKELAAKDAKIAELTDKLMRNMAEFDNFRKRSEKEKSMMYDMGVKSLLEKILPVVDNFERGLGSITDEDKGSAFAQGIELIYRQLLTALDDIGLKPIDAVGKEFDPNMHNAVMHGEDENLGANIVSEEFQKGYIYRDMVVRHSMVKVVN
jgi:molecular chaperone GrpE